MRLKISLAALTAALCFQAQPATATDDELDVGMAESKNLVERTVTIDDQTYGVTGETRILGLQGQPLRLEQVKTVADFGDGGVPADEVTYAYELQGNELTLLKATPVPR